MEVAVSVTFGNNRASGPSKNTSSEENNPNTAWKNIMPSYKTTAIDPKGLWPGLYFNPV